MTAIRMTPLKLALVALLLAAPAAQAREIEIVAYLHDYFHIVPETIHAERGDVLKITVQHAGEAPHDLFFCGDAGREAPPQSCERPLGGPVQPPPGESRPMEVTVPGGGSYWYYCTIPGHAAQGMAGRLEVTGTAEETKEAPVPGVLLALVALALVAPLARRRA